MRTPAFLVALVALLVASCASADRYDAAGDVHALLVAVRDLDNEAFDRHVDREALSRQIAERLDRDAETRAVASQLDALGISTAAAARFASGLLVQPRVFRMAAEYYGYTPDRPLPSRMAIAGALRRLDDDHVCATRRKGGACVLVFTREEGVWRLTGFEGDLSDLRAGLSAAKGAR